MANIKPLQKISTKSCNGCYKPTYWKFNFSFISYGSNLSDRESADLYKRIKELSSEEYVIVMGKGKEQGIELIPKEKSGIRKQISCNYLNGNSHRTDNKKWAVFRLYPNNNPTKGRVIGMACNKIFYIGCILDFV